MALGCHGALQMLLEKQRKGKWIWTWANWLLVGAVFMHGPSPGMVVVQGFVEVALVS